eukprot:sb/3478860/
MWCVSMSASWATGERNGRIERKGERGRERVRERDGETERERLKRVKLHWSLRQEGDFRGNTGTATNNNNKNLYTAHIPQYQSNIIDTGLQNNQSGIS